MNVVAYMSIPVAFGMAFAIGANDVSNAMGTAVGSGSLSIRNAVILGGIVEFLGSVLFGANVSNTISRGIVDPEAFLGEDLVFVLGMFSALLGAAIWILLATHLQLPVSGTHTLVGGVIGFALITKGPDSIPPANIMNIVIPLVTSPVMGCLFGLVLYSFLQRTILSPQPDDVAREAHGLGWLPLLFALTIGILASLLGLDRSLGMPVKNALLLGAGAGLVAGGSVEYWMVPHFATVWKVHRENVTPAPEKPDGDQVNHPPLEQLFVPLQIVTAAYVGFAHGANDVSNAVGPMAAIFGVYGSGSVAGMGPAPAWVMLLGGAGIVVGLASWGVPVMKTVGEKITKLTPSRGYAAQMAASITVLLATIAGMPVSTTHTLIGAITGVGLVSSGANAVDTATLRKIGGSWLITFPAGAFLTTTAFIILRPMFIVD